MTKQQMYNYSKLCNGYKYRSLWGCYDNPSYAKISSYETCQEEAYLHEAFLHSVVSYNTFGFTFVYLYTSDNGHDIICVKTPKNNYKLDTFTNQLIKY